MSEVTFAKSFLATLDKRPIKLVADHVSDPRKYPSQSPYILPRQTHPFPRSTVPTSTQQAKKQSVTATLKPMRSGETVTISDLTLESTIHDVKTQYAQMSSQPQDKIKLLLNKKPAADLKTLKDLGVEGEHVELSVMIMGATTPSVSQVSSPAMEKSESAATGAVTAADKMDVDGPPRAQSQPQHAPKAVPKAKPADAAADILKSDEFWTDLKSYLAQRLKDDKEGEKVAKVFREAWSKRW